MTAHSIYDQPRNLAFRVRDRTGKPASDEGVRTWREEPDPAAFEPGHAQNLYLLPIDLSTNIHWPIHNEKVVETDQQQ